MTYIKKHGKNIEGSDYFYCHKENKLVGGQNVFGSVVVAENLPFSMLLKLEIYLKKDYCKRNKIPFKTKIEMAIEIVKNFNGFENYHIIVVVDSCGVCGISIKN